jgi:phage terminase Nu1 subunit (DNA packaging protein)
MRALDQNQLADRWHISPRTLEQWRWRGVGPRYLKIGARVSELKSAGILPEARRRANDIDACRTAYLEHLREMAAGRGSKDGAVDLVAERARLARAQAEKVERENAVADGEFLPRGEVHIIVTSAFARVRAKMLALPSKLAPELAAIKTPAKVQRVIKDEVYRALNELALPPDSGWDGRNCVWADEPITTKG